MKYVKSSRLLGHIKIGGMLLLRLFPLLGLLVCSVNSYSQTVSYTYDNAGNRLSKLLVTTSARQRQNPKDAQKMQVTDQKSRCELSYSEGIVKLLIYDYCEKDECSLTICTADGKEVKSKVVLSELTVVPVNEIPNGVFIINVNLNKEKKVWKLVK